MKQPPFKRRRVSSNPHTPFPSSEAALVTSPKPSRISTCTSCHRAVGLKSSPAFLCARCNASTCAICLRTCTGDPIVSSPRWSGSFDIKYDSTINPLSQSNTNNSSPNRRRLRDEDNENTLKTKDVDSGWSGCGQMVCRTCCFEHPQSGIVACLGCSVKPLALQSHESLHMPQFKELEIQTV